MMTKIYSMQPIIVKWSLISKPFQFYFKGKGMMDTYWLEGIRESIEEKPEEDEKIISEYITSSKPSKTEDSKSS